MQNKKKLLAVTIIIALGVISVVLYSQLEFADNAGSKALSGHEDVNDGGNEEKVAGEGHENDDHGDEKIVYLTEAEMKELGIELAEVGPGKIQTHLNLPAEIKLNTDRLAHVVPRAPGIVREVRKTLGDQVRKGEVMAVLESRELADTKAAFLAARERVALARANFSREEELWEKKISSEQEYLEAKQALAESQIEMRSAEQKLHALGFSEDFLARLPEQPEISYTRYEILAPFEGTVIQRHITLGEVLKDDSEAYVIADLRTVWVDLSVYQKDLPFVKNGQKVKISVRPGFTEAEGVISYLGPLVGERTRTSTARVVLPNRDGQWKPGSFVNARVAVNNLEVAVLVPKTAIQSIENKSAIFVLTEKGFEPRVVTLGRSDGASVEVESGLRLGETYVSKGGFTLKTEMEKEAFGGDHGH